MEPFFLRCETCHARLRVRDERFLGQVQSCPKCGSMVHILAPVALVAAPPDSLVEAATATSHAARATSILREHSLLASIGTGAVLIAGSLLGYLTIGGSEEIAHPPAMTQALAERVVEAEEASPLATSPASETQSSEVAVRETPDVSPPADEPEQTAVEEPASVEQANVPISTPPIEGPAPPVEPARTLTLEPVPSESEQVATSEPVAKSAEYPPSIEVATVEAEPKPASPAPAAPPARVTNFTDQLSVPIESIDLPAKPIGEFVNLMSAMTAVPIKLDAKVLGDVGMSTRSTVTVRGKNTTAGKLLAGILKEHRLTCIERDGALVVVKAKR